MNALPYASKLVEFDSVSRQSNAPVSDYVHSVLEAKRFDVERLEYTDQLGVRKVSLVAKRGDGVGGIAYFAHTDVVPADDWSVPFCGPFEPAVRDGRLWGRGSCDMKGSLACALAAVDRIELTDQRAPIYLVCTADEEVGMRGAMQVNQESRYFEEMVVERTKGIIGEPTLLQVVHGHKGAASVEVVARGISAHSSTRDGMNANWQLIEILPFLKDLYQQTEHDPRWQNTAFDPPTLSCNLVLKNLPEATNITTALARAILFMRPMPGVPWKELAAAIQQRAEQLGLETIVRAGIEPLWVDPGNEFVKEIIKVANADRSSVVCYATDGGVLKRLSDLVVCGPGSIEQAHRSDEWIDLIELERGTDLYENFFRHWACR